MEVERRSVLHNTADQYAEVFDLGLPGIPLFVPGCFSAWSAIHL